MFTSFVEMFRGRQEEAAETIAELVRRVVDGESVPPDELFAIWAKSSYALADAMLKARNP